MSKKKAQESLKEKIRVEINDKGPCQKEAVIRLSASDINDAYSDVLKLFKNELHIPGFRVGKAPDSLISAKYDEPIRKELARLVVLNGVEQIIDKGVKVVAHSSIEDIPAIKRGADFEYQVMLDIAPELPLPEYKNIQLEAEPCSIDPELVDAEIAQLRDRFAEFEKSDAPATKGDILKISLSSDIENNPEFEKVSKSLVGIPETWVWLSDPEQIPGINSALEGATSGEKRSFNAVFPNDFIEPALAGKSANYEVTILEIQRRKPLDSDEKLCKRMRMSDMESLRKNIQAKLIVRKKVQNRDKNKQKLVESLLTQAGDFPLPPMLLEIETRSEYIRSIRSIIKNEEDLKKIEEEKDKYLAESKKNAEKRLRTYFIMSKIAKQEKINVEHQDINQYISDASQILDIPEKNILNRIYNDSSMIDEIHKDLLVEKVINHLLDSAEKVEVNA